MVRRIPSIADGDLHATTVRLPKEVRAALQRESEVNNRTLSAEIIDRLMLTLHGPEMTQELLERIEIQRRGGIEVNDLQRSLLKLFDAMPPDKQLALLTVLRT